MDWKPGDPLYATTTAVRPLFEVRGDDVADPARWPVPLPQQDLDLPLAMVGEA